MQRARIATFITGGALFAAALALHPVLLDPGAEAAAYGTIAADPLWPAIHWLALAGVSLWTLPLASAPGTAAGARRALSIGLALWVLVLSFEAVAMQQVALLRLPGFWAWTLALGYLAAMFDGVGIALLGWAAGTGSGLRLRAAGVVLALAAAVAYAVPAGAVPVLACAGAAALLASVTAVRRWAAPGRRLS